jgi:hypothetical protein
MTGVEAILDGTPAFKPPEAKNAGQTLIIMATLAITLFVGVTFLATAVGAVPSERETIVSQVGRSVFGSGAFLYFALRESARAFSVPTFGFIGLMLLVRRVPPRWLNRSTAGRSRPPPAQRPSACNRSAAPRRRSAPP